MKDDLKNGERAEDATYEDEHTPPEIKELQARVKELEQSPDYQKLLNMWREEKDRVKELDNSLAIALEINDKHQRYNGELQTRVTELEEDNKKLSHQVEDKINQMRKSGM